MIIEEGKNIDKGINEQKKHKSVIKNLRNGLLVTLISVLPFSKDLQAQDNNLSNAIGGKNAVKIEKKAQEEHKKDSLRLERQKDHFLSIDKWDLMRDISILYYDKKNNKYRRKEVYKEKSDYKKRREITKEQFDNPHSLESSYTQYPNHILIADQKYNRINYKKAKKILDEQRMQARIKKNQAKQNNMSE